MTKLHLHPIGKSDQLARPEGATAYSLNSPATDFFTDFHRVEPLVIDASVSAVKAREVMMRTHVRLKFVLDRSGEFVGVISADDLAERQIVKKIAGGFTRNRDDILVTEMMTPKSSLKALSINELRHASIGDVIEVLKGSSQQHCLVVDQSDGKICGIFSASDISRRLHLPVDIHNRSDFYRVFAAVDSRAKSASVPRTGSSIPVRPDAGLLLRMRL
jgi:CBS domain-containing protein